MALAISALKYNYVTIQHPDQEKKSVDLSNHLVQTEYFENLLSPVITMKMRIRSEFNFVSNLPIRGGEMIAFSAEVGGTTFQFGVKVITSTPNFLKILVLFSINLGLKKV